MKILKSIYENEVEVKEISVLKSLFIIIMFTLIPGVINFLLTFIMILIDENISISDDILSKFFSNIEGFPFNTIGSTSIAFLIFYGTLESFKGNFTEHIKEIHKLSNTNIAYNIAQALDIADSYNTEKSMDITKFMDGVLALSIPDNSKIAILDTYSNYHKYVDEISIHLKASIDALEKEEESISDLLNNFLQLLQV